MRVLILGATGLIGAAVAARLAEDGHQVTALARGIGPARLARPDYAWIACDIAGVTEWAPMLAGVEAVVNCAGALQDGMRDDVAALQSAAMRALFAAAGPAGVGWIVQVSAVGATADAPTLFQRSKAEADAALAAFPGKWVVLRPGLVVGAQAYGATALIRALAALPVLPLAQGAAPVQAVAADEVAEAVLLVLSGAVPAGAAYDLVEPAPQPMAAVVAAFRARLGRPPARVVRLPEALVWPAFRLGDALGRLGWRSPLRSTAWAELARGVTGDPHPWAAAGGPPPRPLALTLRRLPANVQERWFAWLWLLKPVLVGGLALFWLASGLIGAWRFPAAMALLTERGMAPSLAAACVAGGIMVDLALGLLVVWQRWMRAAALGMVAVSAAYLAGATLAAPDLWLDPLGPLLKVVPAALAALAAAAIADER